MKYESTKGCIFSSLGCVPTAFQLKKTAFQPIQSGFHLAFQGAKKAFHLVLSASNWGVFHLPYNPSAVGSHRLGCARGLPSVATTRFKKMGIPLSCRPLESWGPIKTARAAATTPGQGTYRPADRAACSARRKAARPGRECCARVEGTWRAFSAEAHKTARASLTSFPARATYLP